VDMSATPQMQRSIHVTTEEEEALERELMPICDETLGESSTVKDARLTVAQGASNMTSGSPNGSQQLRARRSCRMTTVDREIRAEMLPICQDIVAARVKRGPRDEDRMMSPAPSRDSLLDLPVEMIERIASFLPHVDVLALRATCRGAAATTHRTFEHTNFRSKAFILADAWSMQALVDIAQHPSLGKVLKHVTLMPYQVNNTRLDMLMRDRIVLASEGLLAPRELRRRRREGQAVHARIMAKHERYWAASGWQEPLAAALSSLAATGSAISITLDAVRGIALCGGKHLGRLLGYDDCLGPIDTTSCRGPEAPALLSTVLRSACQFDVLTVGASDIPALRVTEPMLLDTPPFSRALASLRRLDMRVLDINRHEFAELLVDFLHSARTLEHLSLKSCGHPTADLINHVLRKTRLPLLRVLDLRTLVVGEDPLIRFVKAHATTIRHVGARRLVDPTVLGTVSDAQRSKEILAELVDAGVRLRTFHVHGREWVSGSGA